MSNYQSGDFDTKYGVIHVRYPGPFQAYANIQVYRQNKSGTRVVRLQGPALRAFKAAEERIATKKRPHILITGEGYRSYSLQKSLYDTDHQRYADPDASMHVEALAVDIDQSQGSARLAAIRTALIAEGWHYAVDNEPWHASYRLLG